MPLCQGLGCHHASPGRPMMACCAGLPARRVASACHKSCAQRDTKVDSAARSALSLQQGRGLKSRPRLASATYVPLLAEGRPSEGVQPPRHPGSLPAARLRPLQTDELPHAPRVAPGARNSSWTRQPGGVPVGQFGRPARRMWPYWYPQQCLCESAAGASRTRT